MDIQKIRLFLLFALIALGFSLFSLWQQEHPTSETASAESAPNPTTQNQNSDIPAVNMPGQTSAPAPVAEAVSAQLIDVTTDVLKIKIDPQGGDIVRAELTQYPQTLHNPQGVVLLDNTQERYYVAQSGLIGKDDIGPDSRRKGRAHFLSSQQQYTLGNEKQLQVNLTWEKDGLQVIKSFLFTPGSYVVDVRYNIKNHSAALWQGSYYGQIHRVFNEKAKSMFGMQMYQGGALYTPEKPYKKISYSDMTKAPFNEQIQGGWAAMVQRYFLCVYLPPEHALNQYYTRADAGDKYNIGAVTPIEIAPNSEQTVDSRFYIGPEVADTLKALSPGLNLTIDYGILWPISQLIFWLLKTIHAFVNNWGWSIILVTLVIKILFYQLSASSYRSMGNMRRLQPKIELLKQRHGDDKQQFSTAMMDLYRKEKVNPLGGCLPILIQIPVFIALYYVLLESVELRQAPFILWIKDLSSRDPYYVLPLIMGATMFIQQKMNPAPPDPIQAKMMMFMPVVFTALFLNFPAGLVLYWTVNNILSIGQQWFITRNLERAPVPKKVK